VLRSSSIGSDAEHHYEKRRSTHDHFYADETR
jgi:hypothetical protein